MYLTNSEFDAIKKALELLPDMTELGEAEQNIVMNANKAIDSFLRKKTAINQRTAEYVAEKRKTNKNYARSKKYDAEK